MMPARRKTRAISIGNVAVGDGAPISIQSMTTARSADIENCAAQIRSLAAAGCDIVRVAVLDEADAAALGKLKTAGGMPLVADIHFDYRLALEAIRQGVDALRINPGNIGERARVEAVVNAAKNAGIPIRIGVNGGSLEKHILEKHGRPTAAGMVESALEHVRILEDLDFLDIKVSLKSSDPLMTMEANRIFADECDIPLHLGVTEAGPLLTGAVRNSAVLAVLLSEGIGDTLRISLSADPVFEVRAARVLLTSLGLRSGGLRVVSCPTCGRCQTTELFAIASHIEEKLADIRADMTVAVMGCAVNGPGEAREADVAAVCSDRYGYIYVEGRKTRSVPMAELSDALLEEVEKLTSSDAG